jgi:solute carrier family 35
MISATSFTLVGVINKFITVLLNVMIWDKHSSPMGVFAVCLCIMAGSFYQQSPRRDDAKAGKHYEKLPTNAIPSEREMLGSAKSLT